MSVLKKYICLFLITVMFLLINGCNANTQINSYEEYEKNSIVKIAISNSYESYYFICTENFQIVTCDDRGGKIVITEADKLDKHFLTSCLDSIIEDDINIGSEVSVNDYYFVTLYIEDKEYNFTYGLSSNPYANILVEMIIGSSDYKPVKESLVPFPSTFR